MATQTYPIAKGLLTSLNATASIASQLADVLSAGDLILLTGGIGSGKTTFVQALARRIGVQEPVTSPSFVIQSVYVSGRLPLSHVDLYRLTTREEIEGIGWEDYLDGSVTVVEWADRYQSFEEPYLVLDFALGPREEDRIVTASARGGNWLERAGAVFRECCE